MTTQLGTHRRLRRAPERWTVVRWVVGGVWTALLVVRVGIDSTDPGIDGQVLEVVQITATVAGVIALLLGFVTTWTRRLRADDVAVGRAMRSIDPTVRIVPARPTEELRDLVGATHRDVVLGRDVVWGFGATEASLWQLDGRQALRVLVVRWSRVVHVGIEDGPDGSSRRPVVALHFHRADGTPAVATFAVRRGLGSARVLGHCPALEQLRTDLAAERVVL